MARFDPLGITIDDLPHAIRPFDPVMTPLGFTRQDADGSVAWSAEGQPDFILFRAREASWLPVC